MDQRIVLWTEYTFSRLYSLFLCKFYDFNMLVLLGLHDLDYILAERQLVTTTVAFWRHEPDISIYINLLTSFRIVEGNSPNPSKNHFSRSQRIGFPIVLSFEPTRRGQPLYNGHSSWSISSVYYYCHANIIISSVYCSTMYIHSVYTGIIICIIDHDWISNCYITIHQILLGYFSPID